MWGVVKRKFNGMSNLGKKKKKGSGICKMQKVRNYLERNGEQNKIIQNKMIQT